MFSPPPSAGGFGKQLTATIDRTKLAATAKENLDLLVGVDRTIDLLARWQPNAP
ncbi:MAG: hypothetical protein ABR555_16430 [Pyrinomonadaceae bacterium]